MRIYSDVRRRKLESLGKEEDCRSAEERLRADITRLNQDRKRNVLKLKVRSTFSLFLFSAVGFLAILFLKAAYKYKFSS